MKNNDLISKRIAVTGTVICGILLSTSVLIGSIGSVNKSYAATPFLTPAPSVSGDIMMCPYISKDGSEIILVWNTSTGKSVSWYFDNANKKFQRSTTEFQLPTNPF